jgi:hypothetical protein
MRPQLEKTISAPARRAHARARTSDAVGDPSLSDVNAEDTLDCRITAYASQIVASACVKVRGEAGPEACRLMLDELIVSAAHVASGADGVTASEVLRKLSESLDPTVRERANA